MAPGRLLERNVRPRLAAQQDEAEVSDEDVASGISEDEGSQDSRDGSDVSAQEDEDELSDEEGGVDGDGDGDVQQKISNVSFGALKQAQDALSRKRKRGSDTNADHEDKLEALRARLREIKESKKQQQASSGSRHAKSANSTALGKRSAGARDADHNDNDDVDNDSDSDSAPSEEEATPHARSSKHAPAAQSSRYQVSRKRNVIELPKSTVRDPRFDALHNHQSNKSDPSSSAPEKADKAYGFLLDYQKDEIAELKRAVKTTRNEDEKELLRRRIGAMENRLKAKEAKNREQEVLRKHRREERERVQQGKQPFYLKRKDVKEQALVEKFRGMKGKERERAMERRRRKESQRERRMMPRDRRVNG